MIKVVGIETYQRPIGIVASIEECCLLTESTDLTLLEKMNK
jgi:hypothetical protein